MPQTPDSDGTGTVYILVRRMFPMNVACHGATTIILQLAEVAANIPNSQSRQPEKVPRTVDLEKGDHHANIISSINPIWGCQIRDSRLMPSDQTCSTGWIYIMQSEGWPAQYLKIGKTSRDPDIRAKELSNTSVPEPVKAVWRFKVTQLDSAENTIHQALVQYRVNKDREFFNIPLSKAILICNKHLENFAVEDIDVQIIDKIYYIYTYLADIKSSQYGEFSKLGIAYMEVTNFKKTIMRHYQAHEVNLHMGFRIRLNRGITYNQCKKLITELNNDVVNKVYSHSFMGLIEINDDLTTNKKIASANILEFSKYAEIFIKKFDYNLKKPAADF